MSNQDDLGICPPDQRRVMDLVQKRSAEIIDVQDTAFQIFPIGIIPKAMDSDIAELLVEGEPLLWPEMQRIFCLAPCLPRATSESMDENEVNRSVLRIAK